MACHSSCRYDLSHVLINGPLGRLPPGSGHWGIFLPDDVGSRVAVWESYLAVIVVTVLIWIELSIGMAGFLEFSGASDVEFGMFGTLTPGIRILGSMWDRLVPR